MRFIFRRRRRLARFDHTGGGLTAATCRYAAASCGRKTQRRAVALLQCVLPALFIVVGRPVIVVDGQSLYSVVERPPSGVKSKRIFLSADSL